MKNALTLPEKEFPAWVKVGAMSTPSSFSTRLISARAFSGCGTICSALDTITTSKDWFDAVTAFETVYFWPDLPRCFREVYRVLKPGGTFLICNEANGDTDKDEKWTEIVGGMTIYKDAELKTYLEQAGFHDVQIHKKKSWLCITARK